MMDINTRDTIVLSDNNKYLVVSKINYNDNIYYYLIDEKNNENIKFCCEKFETNSFIEVENENLIKNLLPLFANATKDFF